MFNNTDRTKFFEFIVPIVPIINHSNSIDMVLKQGQRLSLMERLDRQFLKDVSRYLSDLRLIRNIFNEYAIYEKNLESGDVGVLDPNKLLAVLIYKNVLPNDFEALHQQKGALANLLSQYNELIDSQKNDLNRKISDIEAAISEAKKQLPKNVSELRRIYAMALIEEMPDGHAFVRFGKINIPIGQLPNREDLSQIIAAEWLGTSPQPNGGWVQFNVPNIEAQIDERMTFVERESEIERKSSKCILQAGHRVRGLKSKISSLRTQQFAATVRKNAHRVEDCFDGFGDYKELMKFLVFEGHLSDTYYQYISLFHEGRLSPHDNNFLRRIRSLDVPDPDFQIDNPAEVIVAMREEDFGQKYVLNRHIFDCLLDSPSRYGAQISSAFGFIAKNFADCEAFFVSYYERGRNVPTLVSSLLAQWPDFPTVAVEDKHRVSHIARVVAHAPEQTIQEERFVGGVVSSVLSTNTAEILNENAQIELSKLKVLRIEVTDLPSLVGFPKEQAFVAEEGLYAINIPNIRFVFEHAEDSCALSALDVKHYTTVMGSDNDRLKRLVEAGFAKYVSNVLLKLEGNCAEDATAILAALRHDEVSVGCLEEFWSKQSTVLPLLSEIPDHLRPFALEHRKIAPSWENCLTFLSSENFTKDRLSSYLADDYVKSEILSSEIPGTEGFFPLHQFVLNNEIFESPVYRSYIEKLPREFEELPKELGNEKLKILIEESIVSLNANNFNFLKRAPQGNRLNGPEVPMRGKF